MGTARTIDDLLKPFHISGQKLAQLATAFSHTFSHLALQVEDQFLPTPVTKLPTGRECGEYLALDLGGTNLRVAFVTLSSQKNGVLPSQSVTPDGKECLSSIQTSHEISWPIEPHLKLDQADALFLWVGSCLEEVISSRYSQCAPHDIPIEIYLGITFSFPMIQDGISKATLMPMGKGFAITSNMDLTSMIYTGYRRHVDALMSGGQRPSPPSLKIVAIANDSVATFLSLAYMTRSSPCSKTVIGLILGTGSNAATPMRRSALKSSKLTHDAHDTKSAMVVVNTEWTIKGASGPLHALDLITPWDAALSRSTTSPDFQPFEYMTAGAYVPELVRLVLLDFYTRFRGHDPSSLPLFLHTPYALSGTELATLVATAPHAAALAEALNVSAFFGSFDSWAWTEDLATALLRTERAVLRRSAALVAAALVGLLLATGELQPRATSTEADIGREDEHPQPRELLVACCGSLVCLYNGYKERLQEYLDRLVEQLVGEEGNVRVVLKEAPDGGLVGAAVLAAMLELEDEATTLGS